MKAPFAAVLAMMVLISGAAAQVQSNSPADRAVAQNVSQALIKAGIDPRTTSVRVITTAEHVIYLSGLIFPIENIPIGLRWISSIVQARYFIVVVRDAFLQGGGWPAVGGSVAAIGAIGLAFYTLAWRSMRRMQIKA